MKTPHDTWALATELEAFESDYVTTTVHGELVLRAVARLREQAQELADLRHLAETQRAELAYRAEVIEQRNAMLRNAERGVP